jgi:N-acetylglucosamine-6-phosphate deacetylase
MMANQPAAGGRYTVTGRLLIDGRLEPGALIIDGAHIAALVPESQLASAPLPGPVLAANVVSPGRIDLQINGGFGFEVGDDPAALRGLCAALPATGVTAFLPTLVTRAPDDYRRARRAFADLGYARGARALGLHLEGPFLSGARSGAHRRGLIMDPDQDLVDELVSAGDIRVMTVAPERPGGLDLIARLRAHGIVVSLGHTDATFDQFVAGIDAGATMTTHLFSAMAPFHHRAPGAVGAR